MKQTHTGHTTGATGDPELKKIKELQDALNGGFPDRWKWN